jgi:hypothetical protein
MDPATPQQLPQPQSPSGKTFDDTHLELLRNDKMRSFLIDIETDSTIQPEEDLEKQRAIEFLQGFGTLMQQSTEMLQVMPQAAPMLAHLTMWGLRRFHVGRNVEEVIEQSFEQMGQAAMQRQQQPDPKTQLEQFKAQMEIQIKEKEHALEREKMQMELQFREAELQLAQQEAVTKMQIEEMQAKHKMQLAELEANHKMQIEQAKAQADAQVRAREAELKSQIMQQEAEAGMQMKSAEFAQKQERDGMAFQEDRQRKQMDFEGGQQRKQMAFKSDEKRKEQVAKIKLDNETRLMNEKAKEDAKKEPRQIKRVTARKKGDATEYELN